MAIFSLTMSFIGKTTQKQAYTASAHIDYITEATEKGTRQVKTCTEILSARMPAEPIAAMAWMDAQEDEDRKNARMIDKVRLALPVELTHDQNVQLVREYCERMSRGRAPWIAAIHDNPEKETNERGQYNPHAHIVFRDRDFETGKRVMMTTSDLRSMRKEGAEIPAFLKDHDSIGEYFRFKWEETANHHLQLAGQEARIDRRSLKDQGVDREAQIHIGPSASHLTDKNWPFESAPEYADIDQGHTRLEANAARIARNLDRDAQQYAERTTEAFLENEDYGKSSRNFSSDPDWTNRESMARQQSDALQYNREANQRLNEEPRPVDPLIYREAEEPTKEAKSSTGPEKENTSARQEKQAKAQREEKVQKNWLDAYIETYRSGTNENDQEGGHEM